MGRFHATHRTLPPDRPSRESPGQTLNSWKNFDFLRDGFSRSFHLSPDHSPLFITE